MFKYEDDMCSASRANFNFNLEFFEKTYRISDENLENEYLNQLPKN